MIDAVVMTESNPPFKPQGADIEVSVVIPCLNESSTLGGCLEQAQRALSESGIKGEVLVADNGSDDGSVELALEHGARVVNVERRGYGSALIGGIQAAEGRFIVMGDADASYDFGEIPNFVTELRKGVDLVQGCRFPSGGGRILPGAMPPLHRWFGNPMFSRLARWWFRAPIHDAYCGLRGFSRSHFDNLELASTGMEFAVEMVIKSSLRGSRLTEIPITLHPDKRQGQAPHLRTFRDGWRTLRFFLMHSPRMLFMLPGLALVLLGAVAYGLAMPGVTLGPMTFDAHTLLFGSLFLISGYQSILFGRLVTAYAQSHGILPWQPGDRDLRSGFRLEWELLAGALGVLAGIVLLAIAVNMWRVAGFGALDYASTMRWVVPGVTLTSLGFQTVLSGFGMAVLLLGRQE